jgi:RNA polymerase sigma-70 factor (ECF subfamily)
MGQAISEAKLREWMRKMGPRLINIAAAICRDRHQAEEIVQEAFVKLWQRPPTAGEIAYPAWLRRVVVNLSINALQRTRRPGPLPEQSNDRAMRGGAAPDSRCEQEERLRRIRAALDRLDESKRSILVLRAYEQLSYEAIAEHLGVPIGTVMSRLNRARTALMEELKSGSSSHEDEPLVFDMRKYRSA